MCLHVEKWSKKFFHQDNDTTYNEVRFVGTNENFATVFSTLFSSKFLWLVSQSGPVIFFQQLISFMSAFGAL